MHAFFSLIDRLNAVGPAERRQLEDEVWNTFGVEKAILCLDMSQFSLSVRRSGIVPYLGLIRRMRVLSEPIVRASRGVVVKADADNLMAVFDNASDAVEASVSINRACAELPPDAAGARFAVGIGIDYGRFLMIADADCYGDPVNVAYKLGEDLARPGEVLITAAVRERLADDHTYRLDEQRASLSGLELLSYCVRYA
jgi:adenylate cyclase